jgi:hypothetical protein
MSDDVRVGVRHRNGKVQLLDASGCAGWKEAREYVLEQLPSAGVVLALIVGKLPRPTVRQAA